MPIGWIRRGRLARALGRLTAAGRDQRGVAAVIFALTLAVLMPVALGVFDIYTATEQRAKLQDALDAATLFAARSNAQTDPAVNDLGSKALAANLKLMNGATLKASDFHLAGTKVVSSATVQLAAFAPAFWSHPPVTVGSEVQRAIDRLEVALVLDNTGSMQGTKLTTLQTEAKNLVDKLAAAAARSADPNPLKISLVPFSSTVRVQGTTALTTYDTAAHSGPGVPAWIDPLGKSHWNGATNNDIFDVQTDRLAMLKNMGQSWAGCVESRPQPYDVQEDAPNSSVPASMFVPYFWPDELGSSTSNSSGYFNSYLNDTAVSGWQAKLRDHNRYTVAPRTGQNPLGFSYGPNSGCALQAMIPLTADTVAIKTAVDGMTAIGETNIPMGLVWGWHTLSPNGPLTQGSAYGTLHLKKVIILMTDGENTFMNSGNSYQSIYDGLGYIWQGLLSGLTGSSTDAQRTAAMDARLAQLCSNIKAKNIYIYTIRVEVTSGTSALLQNCATQPDMFYDVQNVATLGAAFDAIAGSIANLRISK